MVTAPNLGDETFRGNMRFITFKSNAGGLKKLLAFLSAAKTFLETGGTRSPATAKVSNGISGEVQSATHFQ